MRFKENDIVICINNKNVTNFLTLNKKYTTSAVSNFVIYMYDDTCRLNFFSIDRFKLDISEIRKEKLNKINEYEVR